MELVATTRFTPENIDQEILSLFRVARRFFTIGEHHEKHIKDFLFGLINQPGHHPFFCRITISGDSLHLHIEEKEKGTGRGRTTERNLKWDSENFS
jgi:hypothetical protein